MATKIAFSNLKGGVGKTVSATAVATILADRGYKVLLVDGDPQRNSTSVFRAEVDGVATMYDIIFSGYDAKDCIQRTEIGDCIANDEGLINADGRVQSGPKMYKYIKKAIQSVEDDYDYIIFDTPPYRGILLGNILMCSQYVIVPIECELFGIQGLHDFYTTVEEFNDDNEELCILGMLKVKYKQNQKLTRDIEESALPTFAEKMNCKIFNTTIRESVKCREAIMCREKLSEYAPNSTVYQDYNNFVDELLMEVEKHGIN